MNHKVYKNKDKYDIYNVYGKYICTCTNEITANELAKVLDAGIEVSQDDIDIINRASELNSIKEPVRDRSYKNLLPANDNSILNSPIAKATRKILGKEHD